MEEDEGPQGRVVTEATHGGHVVPSSVPGAAELDRTQESVDTADAAEDGPPTTPFGYLLSGLAKEYPAKHLSKENAAAVAAALKGLGAAMVEDPPPAADPLQGGDNSTIPPIYTYWGQFVDHDLTLNTDSNIGPSDVTLDDLQPLEPDFVLDNLRNLRSPKLNLDSLYGDGPTFPGEPETKAAGFYDGIRFKVGTVVESPGVRIPPLGDDLRDLHRIDKKAQIADNRNDENLVIAQIHVAFLRFHNAVVGWVEENEPEYGGDEQIFARARHLVIQHYQWLSVNDYLRTVTKAGILDQILLGGPKHYPDIGEAFMPLEFSTAAFRFGHSMVRAVYDWNRNFGRPDPAARNTPNLPSAPFSLLFAFTGDGGLGPPGSTDQNLPFNWVAEFPRLTDKGATLADRFARRIDTRLAPPLRDMVNQGTSEELSAAVKLILKRLATRNLLRGYLLAIPTGQAMAEAMGVKPLTANELRRDNNPLLNDALASGDFLAKTPLWYYVLKEAEVQANGNSLGELGSRIVCETIVGQLRHDRYSYLNQTGGWDPSKGVKFPDGNLIVTIGDLFRFAGVME